MCAVYGLDLDRLYGLRADRYHVMARQLYAVMDMLFGCHQQAAHGRYRSLSPRNKADSYAERMSDLAADGKALVGKVKRLMGRA